MNREERNAYMREWNKKHYHENLEKSRARGRDWYHKNKDRISEKVKERSRIYRKNNPDKIKAYNSVYRKTDKAKASVKRWREENKEYVNEQHREYFKKNPHKRAEYERSRRARKQGCWGNIPSGIWQEILDFYENRCLCCGSKDDLTQDHVVPLSKGGKHSPDNVQPLCGMCNYRKNSKTIDYRKGRVFIWRM